MEKLEPRTLRDAVKNAYEFWEKKNKEDCIYFQKFVMKTAVECAKYAKKSKNSPGAGKDSDSKRTEPGSGKNGDGDNPSDNHDGQTPLKKKKRKWRDKCLNPRCNEKHALYDCKMTNKDEAKELLAKYRAEKLRKKGLKGLRQPCVADDSLSGNRPTKRSEVHGLRDDLYGYNDLSAVWKFDSTQH